MYSFSLFVAVCIVAIATSYAYPSPAGLGDIFPGFIKNSNLNAPDKNSVVVKRRIFEDNPDASLKQVSLQSLIGDLEQTFLQSALSAGSVSHNKAIVPEATPATVEHPITKRQVEDSSSVRHAAAAESTEAKVVRETTERVPAKEGIPAHVIIDRISVQPHSGGLPIIPAFQVQHTKLTKDQGPSTTKISITQTNIQAAPALSQASSSAEVSSTEKQSSSDHTTATTDSTTRTTETATSTTTSTTTSTSTKTPRVELKEAEEELREKVAEIEADPVILTARV